MAFLYFHSSIKEEKFLLMKIITLLISLSMFIYNNKKKDWESDKIQFPILYLKIEKKNPLKYYFYRLPFFWLDYYSKIIL